jgi:hypothetical protein
MPVRDYISNMFPSRAILVGSLLKLDELAGLRIAGECQAGVHGAMVGFAPHGFSRQTLVAGTHTCGECPEELHGP